MGKQGYDQRAALVNALNTSGVVKQAPAKKELPKEPPAVPGKGQGKKKKELVEEPQVKTKKDIEEEQRRLLEENERQKAAFYVSEAAKKLQDRRSADSAVTYVQDKDTRKPKAISDISDYWKADMAFMPFMPSDNVGGVEAAEDVDPRDRFEYLHMLNEQLRQLLKLKFHVFWSQIIYDKEVLRCLDTYLRFCLRSHDVSDTEQAGPAAGVEDPVAAEERKVAREISQRVLAVFVRLSRPQETSHDFISEGKFAQLIYEHSIFDVPKLIDLCAIYGDSNRTLVTKIVFSVFAHQELYKDEFKSVVQHMLSGLHQCCGPLQQVAGVAAGKGGKQPAELSVDECIAFLPDILSCFNAIFCFFPEDCVEVVFSGRLSVPASGAAADEDGATAIPLADLMVLLHDALMALRKRSDAAALPPVLDTTVTLLSRLLGLVLGFRMAPRRGAGAFQELLDWLSTQADRSTLLADLGKHGLESTAMEWLASGLVDDAQLDYLEQICGPVLPAGERRRGRRPAAAPPMSGAGGAATSSSSSAAKPAGREASANDAGKIREVLEVVGSGYGEGFVLQCLLHYGGSVPAVVGAILDGSLPPQIAALPQGLSMRESFTVVAARQPESSGLSAEDKRRILGQADRLKEAASNGAADAGAEIEDIYNDDVDDSIVLPGFGIGGADNNSASEDSYAGEDGEVSEEGEGGDPRWQNGKGSAKGGTGKGRGKGGPVQGQTLAARRKEENKGRVANHNRRDGALRKMMRGM